MVPFRLALLAPLGCCAGHAMDVALIIDHNGKVYDAAIKCPNGLLIYFPRIVFGNIALDIIQSFYKEKVYDGRVISMLSYCVCYCSSYCCHYCCYHWLLP